MAGADLAVDLAGDQPVGALDVVVLDRPFAPDHRVGVVEVDLVALLHVHREYQRPVGVLFHRLHELVGDQQAQVELAQAPVLALGADESRTSGWLTSKVPICAPRQPPAELTVKHILS